jgi:hypothetical protein
MKRLWTLLIIFALSFGAFAADETAPVDAAATAVEEVTEPVAEDSLSAALEGDSVTEVAENLKAP